MAVEITGHKAEVSVSEKVTLGVKYTKEWGILKSVEWTIPGKIVKDYKDSQTNAKVTKIEEADKKKFTIDFYWVDGGDGRVVEAKCIFTSGGKDTNKTISATFDVKRPKLDKFESTTDKVALAPLVSPTHLRFGVSKEGVKWDWKISANGASAGKVKDIQLVLLERRQTLAASGTKQVQTLSGMKTPPGTLLLDSENPYGSKAYWGNARGGPWTMPAGGSVSDIGISDSPGMALSVDRKAVSFDDKFSYFLMYKSDKANSIWIPIGMLSWDCKGKATKSGSTWRVVPGSAGNSKDPSGSETFDFPEWDHVVFDDLSWETE